MRMFNVPSKNYHNRHLGNGRDCMSPTYGAGTYNENVCRSVKVV